MIASAVGALILFLIAVEIFLGWWTSRLRDSFQWLITSRDEFPSLPTADKLERFFEHSFDPELGWVRKPNTSAEEAHGTVGEEKMGAHQSKYAIGTRGARANPGHEGLPIVVATYGDSFVFSRQVNDDATWPWYLSKQTNTNVLNYGVGNYGFDQSYLRFLREHKERPTKVAIIGVVPETITRVHSAWKHYYEYGNVLGFKPRFRLRGDKLEFLPNVVRTSEDFNHLFNHLPALRDSDYFYENKFRVDMLRFPWLWSLLTGHPSRNLRMVGALTAKHVPVLRPLAGPTVDTRPWSMVLDQNARIVRNMYEDKNAVALLLALLEQFAAAAQERDCTPIFLLMPYLQDLLWSREHGCFYSEFIAQAKDRVPTIDLMEHVFEADDIKRYYSSDFYGGHMTAKGNEWCANVVFEELTKRGLLSK